MILDRKLHCRDFENLNSAKYFTNSKFPVSDVCKMFHKTEIFLQSSSLNFSKIWILRNISQTPGRHFAFCTFCKIQSAKNTYVPEYLITVKSIHCPLNKLKMTFVLRATRFHTSRARARRGRGTGKALCFSQLKFLFVSPFWSDF